MYLYETVRMMTLVHCYYFNRIFLFLVATNCSLVILENTFLYMCNGMILPLLPVSTLYGTIILFGPADILKLAVSTEWIYWNQLNLFSMSQCWFPLYCLGLLLASPLSWLWLSCFCKLVSSGQFWCILCMFSHMMGIVWGDGCYHNIYTSFLWVFFYMCFLGLSEFFIIFSLSNSFASVRLFMMVDWALWALTLFAQHNTFSLMIFFIFVYLCDLLDYFS